MYKASNKFTQVILSSLDTTVYDCTFPIEVHGENQSIEIGQNIYPSHKMKRYHHNIKTKRLCLNLADDGYLIGTLFEPTTIQVLKFARVS